MISRIVVMKRNILIRLKAAWKNEENIQSLWLRSPYWKVLKNFATDLSGVENKKWYRVVGFKFSIVLFSGFLSLPDGVKQEESVHNFSKLSVRWLIHPTLLSIDELLTAYGRSSTRSRTVYFLNSLGLCAVYYAQWKLITYYRWNSGTIKNTV